MVWADGGRVGGSRLESHPGKAVDNQAGEEVQGGYVHPDTHRVSLSSKKGDLLIRGTLRVLSSQAPRIFFI